MTRRYLAVDHWTTRSQLHVRDRHGILPDTAIARLRQCSSRVASMTDTTPVTLTRIDRTLDALTSRHPAIEAHERFIRDRLAELACCVPARRNVALSTLISPSDVQRMLGVSPSQLSYLARKHDVGWNTGSRPSSTVPLTSRRCARSGATIRPATTTAPDSARPDANSDRRRQNANVLQRFRRRTNWTGKHGDVLFHLQTKCNQMTQAWTIREHRKRLGLSQRKLAKRAGVSFRNLQMWEGFESCPTIESLARLAVALGVDPSAILTRAPRAEWWNRLPPERKPAMRQDNPDFMLGVRYVIDNLMTTEGRSLISSQSSRSCSCVTRCVSIPLACVPLIVMAGCSLPRTWSTCAA